MARVEVTNDGTQVIVSAGYPASSAATSNAGSFEVYVPDPGPDEAEDVLRPNPRVPRPILIARLLFRVDEVPEGGPGTTLVANLVRAGVHTPIGEAVWNGGDAEIPVPLAPNVQTITDDRVSFDYPTLGSNVRGRGFLVDFIAAG